MERRACAEEQALPDWVFHVLRRSGAVDYAGSARDGVSSEQLMSLHSAHRGYLSLDSATKEGFDAVLADAVRRASPRKRQRQCAPSPLPPPPLSPYCAVDSQRLLDARRRSDALVRECALAKGSAVGWSGDEKLLSWIRGSTSAARWWCVCEWFYGSLDADFFFGHGLDAELIRRGVASLPKHLTRTQWGIVRACLRRGRTRTRRFSTDFLVNERSTLSRYRSEMQSSPSGWWARKFIKLNEAQGCEGVSTMMGLNPSTKLPQKGWITEIASSTTVPFSFERYSLSRVTLPAHDIAQCKGRNRCGTRETVAPNVDVDCLAELMRLLDYKSTLLEELAKAVDDQNQNLYFLASSNVQILNSKLERCLEELRGQASNPRDGTAQARRHTQVFEALEQRSNPLVDVFAQSLTRLSHRSRGPFLPKHVGRCVIGVTEVLLRAASEAQSVAENRRSVYSSVAAVERVVSRFDTNIEAHACLRKAALEFDGEVDRLYRTRSAKRRA